MGSSRESCPKSDALLLSLNEEPRPFQAPSHIILIRTLKAEAMFIYAHFTNEDSETP